MLGNRQMGQDPSWRDVAAGKRWGRPPGGRGAGRGKGCWKRGKQAREQEQLVEKWWGKGYMTLRDGGVKLDTN